MALKTIQVVLEGLLLRREKSMKDKNGGPIVPLPKKRFIMVKGTSLRSLQMVLRHVFRTNWTSQRKSGQSMTKSSKTPRHAISSSRRTGQ